MIDDGGRLQVTAYRAHNPRWSFLPLSGEGAALRGARFNPKGMPALYLALDPMTAVREANQGFAFKIAPCVLCSYEVDCCDIVDLHTAAACGRAGTTMEILACPWFLDLAEGRRPATWPLVSKLVAGGAAGALVPSFAPGAREADVNLVLWRWGPLLPHRVTVHDPDGRLPKDQSSWT